MEINALNLHKLRNQAHFEFHTEVKALIERHTAETLNVVETFADYLPLLEQEDKGLEIIKQNELTQQLAAVDEQRDTTFRGIATNIKSLTKHFTAEIREKAETLQIVVASYGNLTVASYNEETAMLYNLTDELLTQYQEALETCGLKESVNVLKQQNEDFRQLMATRNIAIAEHEPIHMRSVRKAIDKVYRLMAKRIEASALLNGEENYSEFIKQLNTRIEYYKQYNLAKPKTKEEEEETTPTENGVQ